jgi:hypothetical protein
MNRNEEKKALETCALAAARDAGVPIPYSEVPGEEPDFTFNERRLGIEVREAIRPASSNFGIVPAAEETFHQEILQMAHAKYFALPSAVPVKISVYFANARGVKRDKRQMAHALAEFISTNAEQAARFKGFYAPAVPEGLSFVGIEGEPGDWWTGEGGGVSLSNIWESLDTAISEKNKLVPKYRSNLAPDAPVWLLLYSTVSISRGFPIPHGIENRKFNFDFDRVFWFVSLGARFVEIQKTERDA